MSKRCSGINKDGYECRNKLNDETDKFCYHHKIKSLPEEIEKHVYTFLPYDQLYKVSNVSKPAREEFIRIGRNLVSKACKVLDIEESVHESFKDMMTGLWTFLTLSVNASQKDQTFFEEVLSYCLAPFNSPLIDEIYSFIAGLNEAYNLFVYMGPVEGGDIRRDIKSFLNINKRFKINEKMIALGMFQKIAFYTIRNDTPEVKAGKITFFLNYITNGDGKYNRFFPETVVEGILKILQV
jgi:hypothetical protein